MELVPFAVFVAECKPSDGSAASPLDAPVAVPLEAPTAVLTTPLDTVAVLLDAPTHRGTPHARGLAPMELAVPSTHMAHGAAAAPALPTVSPPPTAPPPAAWIPLSTPTLDAVATGPSLCTPGYASVPMHLTVNKEEALAFLSASNGTSGVVRHGAEMEGSTPAVRNGVSGGFSCASSSPSTAALAAASAHGIRRVSSSHPPCLAVCASSPSWSPLPPTRKTASWLAGEPPEWRRWSRRICCPHRSH
ncbi:hypothetical protein D1007_49546 [Hordeum vulgare]|nr:hypothetical protein D1007_49546 [Hordeum vulgare]